MFPTFTVLSAMIAGNSLATKVQVVPGNNCGVSTPFKKVETLKEADACAIVSDRELYEAYKLDKIREEG